VEDNVTAANCVKDGDTAKCVKDGVAANCVEDSVAANFVEDSVTAANCVKDGVAAICVEDNVTAANCVGVRVGLRATAGTTLGTSGSPGRDRLLQRQGTCARIRAR
jgi:hypothetical protein